MMEDLKLGCRPIKCELNVLNKAEGSAMLSQGNNVVLAALYGPYELKHLRVQLDDLPFQVNYRTKVGVQNNNAKAQEDLIKTACESMLFPKNFARHEITLVVQEFQDGGLVLGTAINAGCLAMINSGIELQHLVAAVSCSMDDKGEITVDPPEDIIKTAKMAMTIAFESVSYNIVMVASEGCCSSQQYSSAIAACRCSAKEIVSYFKSIVKKYSVMLDGT